MLFSARGPPSLPVDGYDGSLSREVKSRGRGSNLSLPSRFEFAMSGATNILLLYMFMECTEETSVIFCNCP